MKKVRCIVKTSSGSFVSLYWIKFQNDKITGWYGGNWLKAELGLTHLDAHFTYPEDGRYHFSYKSINKEEEWFISVYEDKVKIKLIKEINKEQEYVSREELNELMIGHLGPGYKTPILKEIDFHPFVTMSVPINNGAYKIAHWDQPIKEDEVKETDLIIDVSKLGNANLNIMGLIRHREYNIISSPKAEVIFKNIKLPTSHLLELRCSIFRS